MLFRNLLNRRGRELPALAALVVLSMSSFPPGAEAKPQDTAHLLQAKADLNNEDPEAAITALRRALQDNPQDAQARWRLGRLYLDAWRGADAEKQLRWAAASGLEPAKVRLPLAQALLMQGKHQALLNEIAIDAEVDPKLAASGLALRGHALVALGDAEKAREALEAALSIDEQAMGATLGLAGLAMGQKDYARAQALLEDVLARAPNHAEALVVTACANLDR